MDRALALSGNYHSIVTGINNNGSKQNSEFKKMCHPFFPCLKSLFTRTQQEHNETVNETSAEGVEDSDQLANLLNVERVPGPVDLPALSPLQRLKNRLQRFRFPKRSVD